MTQLVMLSDPSDWRIVSKQDPTARAIADRHYSRQTPGSLGWMPPGKTLTMLTADNTALWGACENLDPAGDRRWRVTIFRNEGPALSSYLIRCATQRTFDHWLWLWGGWPEVPLTTEVNPKLVRRKRDPGRCFLRAGWDVVGTKNGLVVLQSRGWPL